MEDFENRLFKRRFRIAPSVFSINTDNISRDLNMSKFNSKVDLRPPGMNHDSDSDGGKPHVDSVLQPEQRAKGIPRSFLDSLSSDLREVRLKKTKERDVIDAEAARHLQQVVAPTESIQISDKRRSLSGTTIDEAEAPFHIPIPPPLPPKQWKKDDIEVKDTLDITNQLREVIQVQEDLNRNYEKQLRTKNDSVRQLEKKMSELRHQQELLESIRTDEKNKTTRNRGRVHNLTESPTAIAIEPQDIVFDSKMLSRINSDKTPANGNLSQLQSWMKDLVDEKFETLSRLDAPEDAESEFTDRGKRKSKSKMRERTRSPSNNHKRSKRSSLKRRSSIDSLKSTKTNKSRASSLNSVTSYAKSIKSVIFRNTEEEELFSEIEDDEVANIDRGTLGFIDYTSKKFTIHGPFCDAELNVYHAICDEYIKASDISFAKATIFSRTKQAHYRVYALLGSNRRSSLTNRNDWTKISNELQVLDFLFRKTIRSTTKRIRNPKMILEYFDEGRTLDERRFYNVMKSIFEKRDSLFRALRVNLTPFKDIH